MQPVVIRDYTFSAKEICGEMVSGFDSIFNLNRTTEDIVNDIKKRGAQLHASLKWKSEPTD